MTAMRLKRYPSPSGGFALGKMGVGATMLKQGKTAKDYVQSGLVAMWDGIENAGWGVHDANATVWKNLIGGVDAIKQSGTLTWSDDAAVFSNGLYLKANSLFDRPQQVTIEVCHNAVPVSGSTYACLFSSIEAGGVGIQQSVARMSFSASVGNPSGGYYDAFVLDSSLGTASTLALTVGAVLDGYKNGANVYHGTAAIQGIRYNLAYYQIGRDPGDSGSISGPIYSIRHYSRALTAAEIAANYAIDKERFNLP